MKHFYIIANPKKDQGLFLTRKLQDYVLARGGTCGYQLNHDMEHGRLNKEKIPMDTECILVVGGDGTLLRTARDLLERNIPLIGVNAGHIGYLCELEEANAMEGLQRLIESEEHTIEKRMLLSGHIETKGGKQKNYAALNDIVICRSGLLQVVDLVIYVNGAYLNTYSADGIIVATPTGSTAYSMSAGGPIVDPRASLILITPICPHTLNAKSIVLGAEDEIIIEVANRRMEGDEQVVVSFDGDQAGKLTVGDRIMVKRARAHIRILKLSKASFLERLRKKLQGYS